ncbi:MULTISPECIES: SDR family NAD(P)-dependent oxidoreductase [Microbacterium]|uniref:SDR family NAD(P)-dependent oxidoreductase n=1 Tax=Microbacterium TaxID=33882 RepID=UPI001CC006D2|nr:SDR family NAD(P)-dependent oxidoreductase [Microbacterium sp. OVT16B]
MPSPVIVLTGATSGLGRLAALRLAQRGAHLILPARNPAKAAETVALIREGTPAAIVETPVADLSRMDDVRRLGREIAGAHAHVDVLINNAGIHAFESRITTDGYPEMIAVNYLAPWLLTHELLPALDAAPAARVITVASEASRRHGRLHLPDDLTATPTFTARGSSEHYGKSKLLDIMFTKELARRNITTGITALCLDPGFNVTGLGREVRGAAVIERILTALRIGDPRRGADLIVQLATHPDYHDRNGEYWTVRGPRAIQPASPGDDSALQKELWIHTERMLLS